MLFLLTFQIRIVATQNIKTQYLDLNCTREIAKGHDFKQAFKKKTKDNQIQSTSGNFSIREFVTSRRKTVLNSSS